MVHVIHGSAAGLQATGVGGPDDQIWHQDVSDVLGQVEAFDRFGRALTTGDFNNDGRSDLGVAVPGEALGAIEYAGAVHIFYGWASGLQATGGGAPSNQLWTQDTSGILGSAEQGDGFGGSLPGGSPSGLRFTL